MKGCFFTLLLAASCLTAVGQECADDIYPPIFTGELVIPDGLNADSVYIGQITSTYVEVGLMLSSETINTLLDSENPDWFMPIHADNCTDSLELDWQQVFMSGGCLATIYRFYSFSDSNGNQADVEVFVTLIDDESPYLIQGPSDLTLDCSNSLYYQEALNYFESGGGIVAADAVQSFLASIEGSPFAFGPLQIVAEYDDSAILAGEPTTIEVSWRVVDQCGNMGLATSLLILECGSNVEGCMDEMACNFNINANSDDGSCHFLCQYCKEGTVWDEDIQGCIVANPSDSNFDGCVQLNDLLDLLSAYGDCAAEESPWQCGDALDYQGYDYATVLIGDQCWFAENLRSENYENGDAIPSNLSDSDWETTTSGAVAVFGEDDGCQDFSPDIDACDPAQSLEEYGRLYNWHAVDDARGLCPSGWHVPTDGEWTLMTDELGGQSIAGGEMKTTYGWYNGGNGTNSSGFSGLPGDSRSDIGSGLAGFNGFWWSSSPDGSSAWYRSMSTLYESIYRDNLNRFYGFSVRCVRDAE